jgi:hypothetical protein
MAVMWAKRRYHLSKPCLMCDDRHQNGKSLSLGKNPPNSSAILNATNGIHLEQGGQYRGRRAMHLGKVRIATACLYSSRFED